MPSLNLLKCNISLFSPFCKNGNFPRVIRQYAQKDIYMAKSENERWKWLGLVEVWPVNALRLIADEQYRNREKHEDAAVNQSRFQPE